jgi:Ca-activated chloride channel family protein
MAQGTGGRAFVPQLTGELDRAFRDIITDLRTEYLLGFYPKDVPPSKDRFHKLQLRVREPGLQVSARTGYYDDAGGEADTTDPRIRVDPVRPPKK